MTFGFWHGAWLLLFISYDILWTALAVSIDRFSTRYIPFILQIAGVLAAFKSAHADLSFTRITHLPRYKALTSFALKGQGVTLFNTRVCCPATRII